MRVQVLRGTKQQIAETVVQIRGDVREAVVFVEESLDSTPKASGGDIFAEMEPFTVNSGGADYSREKLYTCTEGE
jgi:hypothetical protein